MKAIVTGSSNGLGLAIAKHLAANGIDVAISARNPERLKEVEQEVAAETKNSSILGGIVDFGNKDSVDRYVADILSKWGPIDLLINNAGIYREDTVLEDLEESLWLNLNVNLFSAVRMNEALKNHINPGGSILHIVSIAAKNPRHDAAAYTISKSALMTFVNLQREAFRAQGIKVIALYPGAMNTRSWDGVDVDSSAMIQTQDICKNIMNVLNQSPNTGIEEMVINPVKPI